MKNKFKIKNFKEKNKKGFTLIEILVSLSILFLILGGITLFSVRTLQSYTRSKAMQNAVENARFAIESLSKKLRTSHNLTINSDQINFVDNVGDGNYTYRFVNNQLQLEGTPIVGGAGTNVTVSGSFSGEPTSATKRGYVTIMIRIKYALSGGSTPAEENEIKIRSTVSLRDYNPSN